MRRYLLDCGPLVAYLNQKDPAREPVAAIIDRLSGSFVTTGAVITEAMYFLNRVVAGPTQLAEFVAAAPVQVHDCFQPDQIAKAAALMERYRDVPMDFADATLVLLAESTQTEQILTLDERGFRTYRFAGSKRFKLLPAELGRCANAKKIAFYHAVAA